MPVKRVATSMVRQKAEMARKKAYVVMVTSHRIKTVMKNCDAVRARFAIK